FPYPSPNQDCIPYKIEIASSNMMKGVSFFVTVAILALASSLASAYDPSPLQDFCVAINDVKSGGLNTLGISLARIDYAPYAVNSPHTHPRGTELLVVIEGTLLAGFVTSDPNKLFTKVLNKGDVFIFPIGLIHFQINIGETAALAFASFNSQNPGLITIANAVFGSNPPINPNVLIKAFQLDKGVVEYLQKAFAPN
ncbi:germin-like protein subfamily 1 member 7, partial [Quercus suber]